MNGAEKKRGERLGETEQNTEETENKPGQRFFEIEGRWRKNREIEQFPTMERGFLSQEASNPGQHKLETSHRNHKKAVNLAGVTKIFVFMSSLKLTQLGLGAVLRVVQDRLEYISEGGLADEEEAMTLFHMEQKERRRRRRSWRRRRRGSWRRRRGRR